MLREQFRQQLLAVLVWRGWPVPHRPSVHGTLNKKVRRAGTGVLTAQSALGFMSIIYSCFFPDSLNPAVPGLPHTPAEDERSGGGSPHVSCLYAELAYRKLYMQGAPALAQSCVCCNAKFIAMCVHEEYSLWV